MAAYHLFVRVGVLALATASLVGCSKPSVTIPDGAGGSATIAEDGSKITVKDKEGTVSTFEGGKDGGTLKVKSDKGDSTYESGGTVTEADLGLPFYPGSTEKQGASVKVDTPEAKNVVVSRTTSDEPSKVTDFYKPLLKETNTITTSSDTTEGSMLTGKTDKGAEVVIGVTREKGKSETDFTVTVTTNKTS